jgi:hypothetical protein
VAPGAWAETKKGPRNQQGSLRQQKDALGASWSQGLEPAWTSRGVLVQVSWGEVSGIGFRNARHAAAMARVDAALRAVQDL